MDEQESRMKDALAAISAENIRLRNAEVNLGAQFAAMQRLLSEMGDYFEDSSEKLVAVTKRALAESRATLIAARESEIAAVVRAAEAAEAAAESSADAALDLWAYSLGVKQAHPARP